MPERTKAEETEPTLLLAAELSDSGRVRDNNEDLSYCSCERGVFMVIDGVGGQAAGEVAAQIARDMILVRLDRRTGMTTERIREAITLANNAIFEQAQQKPELMGMACVLTVAIVETGRVTIGHVGDTRLYLCRDGQVEKVTHDHSPVGQMEDAGKITEVEAMRHPRRNEVFRDVGTEWREPDDEGFIEIIELLFDTGSALLLCSDGLTDLVTTAQIQSVIKQNAGNPAEIVAELITAANTAGGKDNVTAVYVSRIAATEAPPFVTQAVEEGKNSWNPDTTRQLRPQPENRVRPQTLVVPISGQINPSQASGVSISKWVLVAAGIILGLTAGFAFSVLRHRQSGPPSPIAPLASQPRNLTVGSGGQYQMISAAMEQARPGDSVEVFPGEYSERIRLKEGVALISQRPREAVILSAPEVSQSAGVSPQTAEIVAVIANGIRGARLIGFRIIADTQHPLDVGLRIINSVVEVTDNQIEGARQSGVFIEGAASTTLRANLIRANLGAGVTIREQAVSQLLHNIIIGNGAGSTDRRSSQIKQFRPGIELINHPQVSLVGNIFAANRGGLISGLDPGQREIVEQQNFATKDLGHLTGIPVQQAKVQR